MSDNKPNWVDKANLASNLLQNVQLQQAQATRQVLVALEIDRSQRELNEQQTKERENRLREFVWTLETAFDTFVRKPYATPRGGYIMAKQMIAGLEKVSVTTSSFSQFADKDRFGRFLYRLQQAIDDAISTLPPGQIADAETYMRYEAEAQELDTLIQREKVKSKEIEFKRAEAKKRKVTATKKLEELRLQLGTHTNKDQKPVRFWHKALAVVMIVAAIILAVIGGLAALLGVLSIGVSVYYLFEGNSRDVGVFFGFGVALLAVSLVPLAVMALIGSRLPKPEKPLQEQIAELEKQITAADTRTAKRQSLPDGELKRYNAKNFSGLLKEQESRKAFMLQFWQANGL